MRVNTKVVWQLTDDGMELLERESYDYDGPVADCKGGGSQTVTQETTVPEFLRPFMGQSSAVAGNTLSRLSHMLTHDDLVADFNPTQQAAFDRITGEALEGEFIPAAQNTFLQAAQGQGLNFLPPELRESLSGFGGINFLPGAARSALTQGASTSGLPQEQLEQLQRTAGGDFLMGGEGFDAAVNAAVRQAQPHILSTFGSAGVGGGTGGLAQSAIGQSAIDAFASQFGQERGRQQAAQGTLAQLGLADRGQQLQSAGLLGDFAAGAQGRGLQAGGVLAGLSDAERARQLTAAGQLPGLAFSGLDQLLNVGNLQQGQAQREIGAPITAQQQLLASALGIPSAFSPLFGSTQTQPTQSNLFGNILGGLSLFGGLGGFGMFGGGDELQPFDLNTIGSRR